jgi:ADP-ribose pyrophosphatase YjhB (NUDIX family)
MNIEKIIKDERPNISESSLKVYVQNLNKLHKTITKSDEIKSLEFLKDYDNVIKVLSDKNKNTMKNYLVAVVIILQSNKKKYEDLIEKFQQKIKQLQEIVNDNYDENEKSDKQEKNWIEYNEILKLLRKNKTFIRKR